MIGSRPLHLDETVSKRHKGILMNALNYLFDAYSQKRRRLGPMAVLHPLRATALFARAVEAPNLISLLSTLFHDILEDIRPRDFKRQKWREMEFEMYDLFDRLSSGEEEQLLHRLLAITRRDSESYYQYIGRMLESVDTAPDLVKIKLADRLDNTLDMRIDLRDPLDSVDFFKNLFQVLFVNTYRGYEPEYDQSAPESLNGARRLYQLFKNTVLLSMIRHQHLSADPGREMLFVALAEASLKEAQRTLMRTTGYHYRDLKGQRKLLLEAMDYCYSGKTDRATKPTHNQLLDGLFSEYFASSSGKVRREKLDLLYQDKPLMIQASTAFIVIFLSFMNDPDYYVHGISSRGVEPR